MGAGKNYKRPFVFPKTPLVRRVAVRQDYYLNSLGISRMISNGDALIFLRV